MYWCIYVYIYVYHSLDEGARGEWLPPLVSSPPTKLTSYVRTSEPNEDKPDTCTATYILHGMVCGLTINMPSCLHGMHSLGWPLACFSHVYLLRTILSTWFVYRFAINICDRQCLCLATSRPMLWDWPQSWAKPCEGIWLMIVHICWMMYKYLVIMPDWVILTLYFDPYGCGPELNTTPSCSGLAACWI